MIATRKLKRIVRIRNNNKHCSSLISQHIQFQLIIRSQLPQFCNIKRCQPCPTGNQNRFRSLSGSQLYFLYCLTAKCSGFSFSSSSNSSSTAFLNSSSSSLASEALINSKSVEKVLFFFRCFVIDIPN